MAETTICYDYELSKVRLFTDRPGVARQIEKRLKGNCSIVENKSGDRVTSWSITIDMKYCRAAYAIAKVLGTDSETESDGLTDDLQVALP